MSSIRPNDSWSTTTPGHGPSPTGGTARWASSSGALAAPGMVMAGMVGSFLLGKPRIMPGTPLVMGDPPHARRLLPPPEAPPAATALPFGDPELGYAGLRAAAARVGRELAGAERVAVWAEPRLETCVAVVGALLAGVPAVPVNPKSGERELEHVVGDSAPAAVLAAPGSEPPGPFAAVPCRDVSLEGDAGGDLPLEPDPEAPALVVYTSGTTGAPKGAVLPRRAIASNLDALADAWAWTTDDVVCHGLPLFHVHGLVVGLLGPLRRGGALSHVGRFSSEAIAGALEGGATMVF